LPVRETLKGKEQKKMQTQKISVTFDGADGDITAAAEVDFTLDINFIRFEHFGFRGIKEEREVEFEIGAVSFEDADGNEVEPTPEMVTKAEELIGELALEAEVEFD